MDCPRLPVLFQVPTCEAYWCQSASANLSSWNTGSCRKNRISLLVVGLCNVLLHRQEKIVDRGWNKLLAGDILLIFPAN
jgi:hypothetical protein